MKPDGSLTDLEMWSFWRDKKGYKYALEDQYPELLKDDKVLPWALATIRAAQGMIDERMQELADEENKLNGWDD